MSGGHTCDGIGTIPVWGEFIAVWGVYGENSICP